MIRVNAFLPDGQQDSLQDAVAVKALASHNSLCDSFSTKHQQYICLNKWVNEWFRNRFVLFELFFWNKNLSVRSSKIICFRENDFNLILYPETRF